MAWARPVVMLVWMGMVVAGCEAEAKPLPKLAQVPEFALTRHTGSPLSRGDLRGHVWIANFIFTSCPDVCPLLTRKMGELRQGLVRNGHAVRFVSFSVDPDTDTPEVLRAYAEERDALFDDWAFVTGPIGDVKRVISEGFRQRMERDPNEPANVFHGSHFVLVDRTGMIRGYYRSEHDGLLQLSRDAAGLTEESP
ncbi:MAG: SCO family protein [Myxococcales bacterium]|nr:SCO family protein [Myxococcales bacterium]